MADASFQQMTVFARVVGAGSLSSAARELGLSPALVSRNLAALEARLGVRLINRTTRSLHLTDEGASYYEACSRLLAEIDEVDARLVCRVGQELRRRSGHEHLPAVRERRDARRAYDPESDDARPGLSGLTSVDPHPDA